MGNGQKGEREVGKQKIDNGKRNKEVRLNNYIVDCWLSFSDWKNKKTANSNKQLTIEMNQAIWQLYKFGRFY